MESTNIIKSEYMNLSIADDDKESLLGALKIANLQFQQPIR
jgi:hypothetical protein